MADEYRRVPLTAALLKFESIGDMVTGVIVSRSDTESDRGEGRTYRVYQLLQDSGELVAVLGSVQITEALEKLPDGERVEITYKGDSQSNSQNRVKTFEIYHLVKTDS